MPASFFFSIAWQYALKTGANVGALLVVCSGEGVVVWIGLFEFAFAEFALLAFAVFEGVASPPHPAATSEARTRAPGDQSNHERRAMNDLRCLPMTVPGYPSAAQVPSNIGQEG
jgi:hypothetical protein